MSLEKSTVPNFVPTTKPYRVLSRVGASLPTTIACCTCSIP